MIRYSS